MAQKALNCPHCEYSTNKRFNLERHIGTMHEPVASIDRPKVLLDRQEVLLGRQEVLPRRPKVPDADIDDEPPTGHVCMQCERVYANADSLRVHMRKCKGKVNPLECLHCKKLFPCLKSKYNHKRFCKALKDVDHVPSQAADTINNYQQCSITNTHNTTNNTLNNNINVFNIANFNAENTSYISRDFATQCFKKGIYGVNPMLNMIYFNDAHPENHNVKIKSLNHGLVEVYSNDKWNSDDMNDTLERMVKNSTGTILMKADHSSMTAEECLENSAAIQSMKYSQKRKLMNKAKAKLEDRRKEEECQKILLK